MNCYLLDGIRKAAFLPYKSGAKGMQGWGGTTADVGHNFKGLSGKHEIALYAAGQAAGGLGLPLAAAGQAIYGFTAGAKKARKAGREYGGKMAKSNPYLAMRL